MRGGAATWKLAGLEKSEKFSSLVAAMAASLVLPATEPPKEVDLAENLPEQKEGSW